MARPAGFAFVPSAFLCIATAWGQGNTVDTALVFTLEGAVYDKTTSAPAQGAKVSVIGTDGSSFSAITNEDGGFSFLEGSKDGSLRGNTTYSILIEKEGLLAAKDQVTTVGLFESTSFVKEYYLATARTTCGPMFPDIRFERNSPALQVDADSVLHELVRVLEDNPTITLEISGHTDHGEQLNLSEVRGEKVKASLIAHGINPGRLHVTPNESSQPRITPEQIQKMSDESERESARYANQRVEFRVLGFDWKP